MKKQIFLAVLAILSIVSQKTTVAQAFDLEDAKRMGVVSEQAVLTDREVVEALVVKYSKQYGVSYADMMATLENENDTFQFDRQSELRYKAGNRWGFPAGTYEKSYGVAQIHLPDHPTITYEQATDPEFAVEFMAKKFSEGRQKMWSGYTKYLSTVAQ